MNKDDNELDLIIRGGTVLTPGDAVPSAIAVRNGRIVALGDAETFPPAKRVIDASGKHILPGIIDPEGHPGGRFSLKEALETETRAAAAWGITTWGLQVTSTTIKPKRTGPPGPDEIPLNLEAFPALLEIAKQSSMVDYFWTPWILNDRHAAEVPYVARNCGVTSFKTYLHLRSGSRVWDVWHSGERLGLHAFDDGMVYLAMKNIAALGPKGLYCLHCENWEIARVIQQELQEQGRKDMGAWCDRSPAFCEAGHVRTYAYYAKVAGCPIYIQHTTTPETVAEILKAKAEGVKVFSQTGPHYLSLDKNVWKINVPLRDREAIDKCWQALADGHIDCIGSDHVVSGKFKEAMEVKGDVWLTQSGFPSRVEALLPVMLSEGVSKGRISLRRLVEVCSENPAKIFGIYPRKGAIAVGSDADFAIVDLNKSRTLTRDMVHSSIGWSMWEGWEFKGWPVMTILRGNVIAEWPEGEPKARIVGTPGGQYLPRQL